MTNSFTQKWAIVSLLEDIGEGSEFHFTEFPLHVTLAGVFAIDKNEKDLITELEKLVKNNGLVPIEATHKDMFGPDKSVAVTRLRETAELLSLHRLIHVWLVKNGAVYNSPQYQDKGYLPHSTYQKSGKLIAGEKRKLTSISLIDLYPHNDGYKRKITKTIRLE